MPFKIQVASGLIKRPSLGELVMQFLADMDPADAHTVAEIMEGIGWVAASQDFSATIANLSRATRLQAELNRLVEQGRVRRHEHPETGEFGYCVASESE